MGVSSNGGDNAELSAAMTGGSTFEQRLAELGAAKQSLADAYTELGLGKTAKAAYEDVQKIKADAETALSAAKTDAKAIVAKAQEDAEKIIASAKQQAESLRSAASGQIEAQKAEAAELRSKAKADADAAVADLADAKKLKAQLAKEMAEQKAATDAAAKAFDAHAAAVAEIKAIRTKVLAALKELENV